MCYIVQTSLYTAESPNFGPIFESLNRLKTLSKLLPGPFPTDPYHYDVWGWSGARFMSSFGASLWASQCV